MISDSDAKPFASRLEKVKSICAAWDKGEIDGYDALLEVSQAIDLMVEPPPMEAVQMNVPYVPYRLVEPFAYGNSNGPMMDSSNPSNWK